MFQVLYFIFLECNIAYNYKNKTDIIRHVVLSTEQ